MTRISYQILDIQVPLILMYFAAMKISVINGPNLNLLGSREPEVYGTQTLEQINSELKAIFPDVDISFFQSNVEGELVNQIQLSASTNDAIVLNAAAYTHTSVAIADAVAAIDKPVVEVHLSNTLKREEFRHTSLIGSHCMGSIAGFGADSYRLAFEALIKMLGE